MPPSKALVSVTEILNGLHTLSGVVLTLLSVVLSFSARAGTFTSDFTKGVDASKSQTSVFFPGATEGQRFYRVATP